MFPLFHQQVSPFHPKCEVRKSRQAKPGPPAAGTSGDTGRVAVCCPGFELYAVSEATQDTRTVGVFSQRSGSQVLGFRGLTVRPTDGPLS